jgi:MerR family transcriptional regulator/heat shock protein HspR
MKVNRKKGYFSISAVADMFSIHQQTIRLYEKQGLINPDRSSGNTRLFKEDDIDRLEEIVYLTHELGINLAGVEMILKLKRQIARLQKEVNKAFEETKDELDREVEESKPAIQRSAKRLMRIKEEQLGRQREPLIEYKEQPMSSNKQTVEIDNWEIEYEDN